MIEDETKIEGPPESLGLTQVFTMQFTEPNVMTDYITNDVTVGAYYAVTLNLQKIPSKLLQERTAKLNDAVNLSETQPIERNKSIGELLYLTGLTYFAQLDMYDHISSRINGISYIRHPSEGMTILGLDVSYIFSIPSSVSFAGMGIDVDRDIFSPFSKTGDKEKVKNFMLSSGMTGSAMEHGIFELLYNAPAVSAVKILQIANENKIPVYSINKNNINQILPKLQVSQDVKTDIQNSINAGKEVTIPKQNIQYYDWEGVGYTIIDPDTGAGAYIISGGIAGGWIALIELVKLILEAGLDSADKVFKQPLAKVFGPILTIIEYLLELYDVLIDPNLHLSEECAKVMIITGATLIIASLGLLTALLGGWELFAYYVVLILITLFVDWVKNWMYKDLGISFNPFYKFRLATNLMRSKLGIPLLQL
jgi:hypothetical protein